MQADTLRFFRMAKNLKQDAVAAILDVSQPYYSRFEDGSKKLSPAYAEKLAEFYGVSKEIFLNDKLPVINHNVDEHNKMINNTDQYGTNKDLVNPLLERIDKLLSVLLEEKKELTVERKELLAIFSKLADNIKMASE